jgi:hypothetical protein
LSNYLVSKIGPATEIFLYNFQSKMVFGIFMADGDAAMRIDPTLWEKFPAQVQPLY